MFSRIGKETVIRDLTFIDELAGNKGVESTFEQLRKKEAVDKKKNARNSGQDNDEFKGYDLDDFYNNKMDSPTAAAPVQEGEKKEENKKDGKSATQKAKEVTKKNKTDKSQEMSMAQMLGGQKETLHTIFENLQAELDHKEKQGARRRIVNEVDCDRERDLWKLQDPNFKSGVQKFEDACYKIIDKPVSLNEGNYRINFQPIDAKVNTPALHEFPKHKPNKHFFKNQPCIMDKAVCSLSSRS